MEEKLIEIKREQTNFFTSIFVYDNKKAVPKKLVEMADFYNDDNKFAIKKEKKYVVFFKDLETNEILEFFVDRDAELINKNKLKTNNNYLIEKMQEFVRINCYDFQRYYDKRYSFEKLVENIKIYPKLFTDSRKVVMIKNYLTDDDYFEKSVANRQRRSYYHIPEKIKDLHDYFNAKEDIFSELVCRCILWNNNQEAVKIWKKQIDDILDKIEFFNNRFKTTRKKAFNSFFNQNIDAWDIQCYFHHTQIVMGLYFPINYKKFGPANVVDYKKLLRIYNKFKKEFFELIVSNYENKVGYEKGIENRKNLVNKYLEIANEKCVICKQNKYIREYRDDRQISEKMVVNYDNKEIKLNCSYFFIKSNEEIDIEMQQLKTETTDDALFISAEQICDDYFTAIRDNKLKELKNKYLSVSELIVKYAQFFEGKQNVIDFFKSILVEREKAHKPTAIYSNTLIYL